MTRLEDAIPGDPSGGTNRSDGDRCPRGVDRGRMIVVELEKGEDDGEDEEFLSTEKSKGDLGTERERGIPTFILSSFSLDPCLIIN